MSENNDKRKLPLNRYREFFSRPKSIKVYIPDNNCCDNGNETNDEDFVGRTTLMNKLFKWLTDDKRGKGSYLVTGYRGMGKTSLVNRVLNRITRDMKQEWEFVCFMSLFLLVVATFIHKIQNEIKIAFIVIIAVSLILLAAVLINKECFKIRKLIRRLKFPWSSFLKKRAVDKMVNDPDDSDKKFRNIKISINLGHEVIKERDILCLIVCNIKEKYLNFIKSKQHRFLYIYLVTAILCTFTCFAYDIVCDTAKKYYPIEYQISSDGYCDSGIIINDNQSTISQSKINDVEVSVRSNDSWFSRLMANIWMAFKKLYKNDNLAVIAKISLFLLLFISIRCLCKKIEILIPLLSTHLKVKKRLDDLTDRLNSSVDENSGSASNFDKGFISVSLFGNRKRKVSQVADIREIETELINIVNLISSDGLYRAKFYIVFDELDKIDPDITDDKVESYTPEYTDSVKGFPAGIETHDRRKNVLKLLANIKLFISTANAKFIFISGRELYDAFLADLSDRDFAISSIFSGVINVDSFLSPEGGQTDVRSMAELYVANRLIPKEYLLEKEQDYALKKMVLKKEIPSLRWYYEYLMDVEKKKTGKQIVDIERQKDIEFVMIFLRGFAAYLSHISNGSPKKIYLYFDKYVKNDIDTYNLNDWDDEIVVGKACDSDKQSVLFFNATQQNCINFIHYLSGPIMSTITNDLSSFGDRYLVSLSFVIDHIYKHHSRSFSWRDMEQIPELLKPSKAPELRKSVSSIMEFLLQIHISPIVIGFNEYKFHKSISEEIDYMSKISDEASALFNFTLDESLAVIHHNTMLLNHYTELATKNSKSGNIENDEYKSVLARIHSVLGDLHFGDEDYYNATLEYKLSLNLNGYGEAALLTLIRINLKLALTYEYRKMYPNAYYVYCQLISYLVGQRNIDEKKFGLELKKENVYDWRYHRCLYTKHYSDSKMPERNMKYRKPTDVFDDEFQRFNIDDQEDLKDRMIYCQGIDGIISGFSNNLTPQKANLVSKLTLFEEVRYFYQAILAKMFSLEKMVVSGITQTNIDIAEAEFNMLHRITNIEEKFIVSADFFCKLAEILYYKNSLTIRSKDLNSLEATLHFHNFDVYANLEDYLFNSKSNIKNARTIKEDVKFFFENTYAIDDCNEKHCYINLSGLKEERDIIELFNVLCENIRDYYNHFEKNHLINEDHRIDSEKNVKGYLDYCKKNYNDKFYKRHFDFDFDTVITCPMHRKNLNDSNLRPPCYACKYYTRSLKILLDKMIIGTMESVKYPSKSIDILRYTFKNKLRYTRVNQIVALAKSIEGLGNVMLSCASFNKYEDENCRYEKGITPAVVQLLIDLAMCEKESDELNIIAKTIDNSNDIKKMTRLDKCLVYYWDAYRYYLIVSQYDDAINCLSKIMTVLVYYISILNYSKSDRENTWEDESETVLKIVGESYSDKQSLASIIFNLILRHTGFQYDNSGLMEVHELKWLLNKDDFEMIDLSKLSRYPNIRSTVLRLLEINIQGRRYLESKKTNMNFGYDNFIINTYKIVSPSKRYITTTYEEILGYYVKIIYNGSVMKDILGCNQLLYRGSDLKKKNLYDMKYPLNVYRGLRKYLTKDIDGGYFHLIERIFKIGNDIKDKLDLLEFVIHDSLLCLTTMIKVFTPHNHFTSYSKSFIAITYNYLWEWSRYFELLHTLYDYKFYLSNGDVETADIIINKLLSAMKLNDKEDNEESVRNELLSTMNDICKLIPSESITEHKYGDLCSKLYSRLKHDLDDVAINLIFSNYSAESALNYYYMAEETSTEGDAYKDMISNLFFLNDDLNNDTCQFNLACERFLLNCDVIRKQKHKLHHLYKNSNIYVSQNYVEGPAKVWDETEQQNKNRFKRSGEINSEY